MYGALGRTPPSGTTDIAQWQNLDKKQILLGKYSTRAFQKDFESTISETNRATTTFSQLVIALKTKYASTINYILANYDFHKLTQKEI